MAKFLKNCTLAAHHTQSCTQTHVSLPDMNITWAPLFVKGVLCANISTIYCPK